MNKLTISLLLVGLFAIAALSRTSPQIRRPYKFTPGQTYIYEYRGRQWNGIAQVGDQYAGLTLECDVVLQASPDSTGREVLMKLDDIKVEQLHTQTLDSNDVRSLNQGKEQNVRQATMYKEELSKPIRFTYLDGKIVRFIADTTDAEWSINIKKSILSLFQLDLAPTKIIKSPTRQLNEQVYGYNSEDVILATNEMPLIYPIYEESFGGICETLYEIDSVDNVEKRDQQDYVEFNDVLNVTKTVNYKNCLTDPSVSYDRHSFNVNTQTIKGKLFSKQPTVTSQNYYPVPEELKSKYSNAYTSFGHKDNVASPVPVERYSWTKYNIASAPQSLVDRRFVPVSSQADMSLIETVVSEGKIKYQVDGDTLVSETQQNLRLITVAPTIELARVAPELSTLAQTDVRQPNVEYQTIQCELNQQKVKFYQALLKYSQLQQSLKLSNSIQNSISSTNALYSHQLVLPFALSASWYPIVATGQQTPESSFDRTLDPEQLAKSYQHLLNSLADDVLSEDVAQSKKAGEKVVRLVNIVAFMPKYKLAEIYDNIVENIQQAKKAQLESRGKQAIIDNDLVSKYKVVRKLFLDSLPIAGSKQAIEMIETLIETNRVKAFEAKEMCEAVPSNLRYPDTEIIDAFIRISQLPLVRKNRSLFASCSIAAGKMIGQSYAKSKDASYKPTTYEQADKLPTHLREDDLVKQVVEEADPRRQLPLGWNSSPDVYDRLVLDEQDLMKYVKFYKSMLSKANQYHEKVIYIETLAHMKVPQVLPILEPYVTGRLSLAQCLGNQPLDIARPIEQSQWYNYYGRSSQRMNVKSSSEQKDWNEEDSYGAEECNYMRTIAIYALAHVSRTAPDHVQALLLPVFDNTYEPYQIRIAAFTSIMLTPVPEHILERIASQMWREKSKEVASFVVGSIDTFSKMTAPSAAPWKHAAMRASKSMPKQYLDTWKFSWMAGGDHFDYNKDTGLTWLADYVKSNVSSIPRAAYAHFGRYHGTAGGKYDNHFQFGFTSKGLETLFKQYIAYNQQQSTDNTNIIASVFENLYDTKDDIVKYYREARDSIKESILSNNFNNNVNRNGNIKSKQTSNPDNSQDATFFLKSQQPIDGVNTKSGKQARKTESLFEGLRSKRSITFQAHTSSDDDEEAKLTVFSKLFDSTSYYALDKKDILAWLEKSDDYVKMVGDELIMGGKLHYVKMMMPSNMWHMVPSQMGLPIIVTHRRPIVASIKIDGSPNGQLTSNKLSQYVRQQVTGSQIPNVQGPNYATLSGLNITALVHPKIMHSNYRFMFAVEQANNDAYGVQCEKSHQMSLPMELSIAYSQAKKLVSFSIEPKTPARMLWTKEAAKTFIAPVALANKQLDNWLGQEHLVRSASPQVQYKLNQRNEAYVPSLLAGVQSLIQDQKDSQRQAIDELETPYKFEHRFMQQLLGLEFYLEGVTDDENVVHAVTKSDLSDNTRDQLQWSSTEDVDDLDQHSKSGPAGNFLHILESALNRPTKYLEYYTTMKPVSSNSQKSPVYRFDFVLSDKSSPKTPYRGRMSRLNNVNAQQQQVWQSIEQNKMLNKVQQSEPMIMNVY